MVSGDAILASVSAAALGIIAGGWRLASMLGTIQQKINSELSHNGGSSLKDQVRDTKAVLETSLARGEADRVRATADINARIDAVVYDLRKTRHELNGVAQQVVLINHDRFRRERTWADALQQQGLITPSPIAGVETPEGD